MHFRKVLLELWRIQRILGEGVTAEEFADYCRIRMPIQNARVYLLRLYKMNLAQRSKDRSVGATNHPYKYRVSTNGKKYIKYLKTDYSSREIAMIERMRYMMNIGRDLEAVKFYERCKHLFINKELKDIAKIVYRKALHKAVRALEEELRYYH